MDTRRSFGARFLSAAEFFGSATYGLDFPPVHRRGGAKGAVAYPPHMHVLRGGYFWVSWLFPRRLLLLPALGSTGFGSR